MRPQPRSPRRDECGQTQLRLSDYIDGELRRRAKRRVARHLNACTQCGPLYRSLVRTVEGLRSIGLPLSRRTPSGPAVIERIRRERTRDP